jgi:predicted anti-sigma-YlaC factor YlaD
MNCEDHQGQIEMLLDGELQDRESAIILLHLGECDTCRRNFRDLQHLNKVLSGARETEWPEDSMKGKSIRISGPPTRSARRMFLSSPSRSTAILFAATVILAVLYFSGIGIHQRERVLVGRLPTVTVQPTSNESPQH